MLNTSSTERKTAADGSCCGCARSPLWPPSHYRSRYAPRELTSTYDELRRRYFDLRDQNADLRGRNDDLAARSAKLEELLRQLATTRPAMDMAAVERAIAKTRERAYLFSDRLRLPADIEHRVHEFLHISEVCALRQVSCAWRFRIGHALPTFQWDAKQCSCDRVDAHIWLNNVVKARVNVRSLHVDGDLSSVTQSALELGFADVVKLIVKHLAKDADHAARLVRGRPRTPPRAQDTIRPVTPLGRRQAMNADDAHERQRTLLHRAAEDGNHKWMETLLAVPHIDVNVEDHVKYNGSTALHVAISRCYFETAKMLLAKPSIKADAVDKNGFTPLHMAAFWCDQDDISIVQLILDKPGVNVNAACNNGVTPLHMARNTEVVRLLISAPGVDANAADRDGDTPLHRMTRPAARDEALRNGFQGIGTGDPEYEHKDISGHSHPIENVRALLEAPGIDVSAAGRGGNTPLHEAARHRNADRVALLLAFAGGIDVNARNDAGETALHFPAERNSRGVVRALLGAPDIDVGAEDNAGRTAVHCAVRSHSDDVVQLFKEELTHGKGHKLLQRVLREERYAWLLSRIRDAFSWGNAP